MLLVSAPSDVQYLGMNWDDQYNLTFTWYHPYMANGPLTKFLIKVSSNNILCNQISFPVNEANYRNNYTYVVKQKTAIFFFSFSFINACYFQIPFKSCYSSEAHIAITAVNTMFEGSDTSVTVVTPPRTASFTEQPSVKSTTLDTIIIDLPTVENFEENR